MKHVLSVCNTIAWLVLAVLLALAALKVVQGFLVGNSVDGWKAWLMVGLLFFIAEQFSALSATRRHPRASTRPALPRMR